MQKKKRELKHWDAHFAQLFAIWLPSFGLIVETKFSLGRMPLQADAIVIKKTDAEPLWSVHPLWKYLSDYNIVEFKSISDRFEQYDLGKLITYGFAYQERNNLSIESDLSLWLVIPKITETVVKTIEKQKETITNISQGFHKAKAYFPLYIIEYEELPIKEDYYGLKLFGREIKDTARQVIKWEGTESLWREYIDILTIFHLETFKEVEKMLSQKEIRKGQEELLEIILQKMGKNGYKKIINKIGEEKIINTLGKEKIINTLGKDEIIKYLETQGMKVIKE